MLPKLARAWRLFGTGLSFVVFLGGGLLLAVVVFPAVNLITRSKVERRERCLALLRGSFQAFVRLMTSLRVIGLRVDDPQALLGSQGAIVIANHPTLIDVVLLSAYIPRAQCIVKRELWNSPFLGSMMRANGYIPSDLEPEALIAACRAALDDGRSLIVFPEGTRSRAGTPLRFHRGFAHIATMLNVDIQLAIIRCNPILLGKGERWWEIPSRRPLFNVSSAGRITARDWQHHDYRSLAVRNIVQRVERLYNERLAIG